MDNVTVATKIKGWVNVTTNDEKALKVCNKNFNYSHFDLWPVEGDRLAPYYMGLENITGEMCVFY